jgi:hypothetical protein
VLGHSTSGEVVPTTIIWTAVASIAAARRAAAAASAASDGVDTPRDPFARSTTPAQDAPYTQGIPGSSGRGRATPRLAIALRVVLERTGSTEDTGREVTPHYKSAVSALVTGSHP